ncbi:MAG: flagellar basal body protein FliL [Treponema sp.]|nr:flagellar basal body protein FliL [Treponema sp.]
MKRVINPSSSKLLIVYRLMVLLLLFLILILIAGTMYGLLRKKGAEPLFRIGGPASGGGRNRAVSPADAAISAGEAGVFTGIGRLRIPVARTSGGSPTLVLSIAFPYPPQDQAFTEELASRITDFRAIAVDYFSSLPAEQITALNEESAKAELLRRYNTALRLGSIKALYFNDLMIIE